MTMPACYGQVWEGVAGSLCVDQGCGVIDDCLMRFASGVLVDWQRKLGEDVTVEQLVQATAVKTAAIERALEFQKSAGIIPFVKPAVGASVVPSPITNPLVLVPEKAIEEPVVAQLPEIGNIGKIASAEGAEKVLLVSEQQAEPSLAEVVPITGRAQVALEEVASMAPKKKGKAKAAPQGKLPRGAQKKGADKPIKLRPKLAATVQSARVAARKGRAVAQPVRAQEENKSRKRKAQEEVRRWHARYNRSRWQRERERSALIAQLRPGMKLSRIWQGKTLQVVVLKGGYKFQGQLYPTLYSVVREIVGTIPRAKQKRADGSMPTGTRQILNWSAPRFFRLPWIIGGRKGRT